MKIEIRKVESLNLTTNILLGGTDIPPQFCQS